MSHPLVSPETIDPQTSARNQQKGFRQTPKWFLANAQLSNFSSQPSDPCSQPSNLSSQISALNFQISALKSQPSALKSQLPALSSLSPEISPLSLQISAISSQISVLSFQISALSGICVTSHGSKSHGRHSQNENLANSIPTTLEKLKKLSSQFSNLTSNNCPCAYYHYLGCWLVRASGTSRQTSLPSQPTSKLSQSIPSSQLSQSASQPVSPAQPASKSVLSAHPSPDQQAKPAQPAGQPASQPNFWDFNRTFKQSETIARQVTAANVTVAVLH